MFKQTTSAHFVRGAVFQISPGADSKSYQIAIGQNCEQHLIDDLKETWEYNPRWFRTVSIPEPVKHFAV